MVLNESKMCEQGRNFCNKMWNALRLVKGWQVGEMQEGKSYQAMHDLAIDWFEHKFNQTLVTLEGNFKTYRLSDSIITLYNFIWDDFCSWYLEMIKPEGGVIDASTLEETTSLFERLMTVLHPFMPFVTEELWHLLRERAEGDDCTVSTYPLAAPYDAELINMVEKAKDLIAKVREIRNNNGIKARDPLRLFVEETPSAQKMFGLPGLKDMVMKMAYLSHLEFVSGEVENSLSILSGTEKYHLEVALTIDKEAEREKLEQELKYYRGFVESVEKKLSNERFVAGAPKDVVEKERQKMEDGKAKIKILEENLRNL
jgi:valyl-tRNA synthetase